MNNYLGDFAEDVDVYLVFDTADSTGLSITATIVVGDIEVYRQNTGAINLTQRSSTAGFTLDVDHDAMTGTHMVAIDTSDNTDAGFFTTGYDYFVKLNTITVDGISISKWIGHFSIENRYSAGALRPTTAGRTLDVTATGAAGIDWGNVENKTTANDLSGTDIQLADTVTTLTGHTAQTGDNFARLGAPAGASVSADIADVPTVAEFNARTLLASGYFDPAADTVANVTLVATTTTNTDMRGTDSAALASVATEARLSELDEATAGKMANQVDIIQTDTTTDIPALIAGLNDVSVSDILTTQMTEAYAADGVAPTLAQALFLIQQTIGDFAIAGTTITTKKLDGATTAATYTLDDGTNPTSRTRAT